MGSGETGFRTRAATLLHSSKPFRSHSQGSDSSPAVRLSSTSFLPSVNEKASLATSDGREPSTSVSTAEKTLTSSIGDVVSHDSEAQRIVRTLPSWVQAPNGCNDHTDQRSRLLPQTPTDAQVAQHNNSPSSKHKSKHEQGRLWDGARESEPPFPRASDAEHISRWRAFIDSSAQPHESTKSDHIVTDEWLLENGPDYSRPWLAGLDDGDPEKAGAQLLRIRQRRMALAMRIQRTVLRNPIVPLVIRMVVWFFSLIALTLGCQIYRAYKVEKSVVQHTTSPEMAIIVDAVALPYIIYITYDEYTGKPLGLRRAKAKMRLIFLDLFFIVFDSANLSLAFEALSDFEGTCLPQSAVCDQQTALAAVLLIALIAWLMTFSISVLRLVERVERE